MPLGQYKDFAACVAANGDKQDPKAYCGELESRINKRVGITKLDDSKQQVFGWSTISERNGTAVVDLQDDVIPPEVLEEAVYDFMLHSRESGEMHVGKSQGHIIESVVFTPEKLTTMGLTADPPFSGHWIGVQFDDAEVFKRCKSGEYNAFSIQGSASV